MLRFALLGNFANQVAHQLLATRRIQRQHHRFADRVVIEQSGFDLTQLDAETTDFHLMVDPAQVFHQTIGALAHQIAGAVHAPAIGGKRVGDKTLGADARTVVITLGQTGAADEQFTGRALRYQRQIGIENVRHTVTDHAADRHAAGALFQNLRRKTGERHDHGFSRAIGVEEQTRFERGANPLQVFAGQRFAAGDDHPRRQNLVLRGQELRQLTAVARGETEHVDFMRTDQRADFFRVPLPLRPQHHLRAAEQRHQQTLGGGVEVD